MSERRESSSAERYQIDALIGRGGMSDVYRGKDVVLQRRVAIKILTDRSEDLRKRFLREAQSMARLNHPNIVGVLRRGAQNDGVSYIVMELVQGRTLATISPSELTVHTVAELLLELLEALAFAHENNVIHRDVKPANIMVLANGDDQGDGLWPLAPHQRDVERHEAGEIVGTIAYLSPERFLGRSRDARSDLYSVGVRHVRSLHRRPFRSRTSPTISVAVIFAHVNEAAGAGAHDQPGRRRHRSSASCCGCSKKIPNAATRRAARSHHDIGKSCASPVDDSDRSSGAATDACNARRAADAAAARSQGRSRTAIEAHRSGNPEARQTDARTHSVRRDQCSTKARQRAAGDARRTQTRLDVEGPLLRGRTRRRSQGRQQSRSNTRRRPSALQRWSSTMCARSERPDDDEVDIAIESTFGRALLVLRGKRLFTAELDDGERMLYALRRIRVGTRTLRWKPKYKPRSGVPSRRGALTHWGYADVGADIFVALGLVFGVAGGASNVAFLFAGLVYVCVGLAYTELAAAYPVAGGGQYFVMRGLGDLLGFMAGWAVLLDFTIDIALFAWGSIGYLSNADPAIQRRPPSDRAFRHRVLR